MIPSYRPIAPEKLRRLADALQAHEEATAELWTAARHGQDDERLKRAFNETRAAAQRAWHEAWK